MLDAADRLASFGWIYSLFTAETPAGTITLNGLGSAQASELVQRQIAETARWIADAAVPGRSSADAQLALNWRREASVAGFCDELSVYSYGEVLSASCQGGQKTPMGGRWLSVDELVALYVRLDRYDEFASTHQDPPDASDGMIITLSFYGFGKNEPSENEAEEVLSFATELHGEIRNEEQAVQLNLGDPEEVVIALLQGLLDDPFGGSSVAYLNAQLRARVTGGTPLTRLLGIENIYRAYETSAVDDGRLSGVATVEATLHYFSDYPVTFTLRPEENEWRVSRIEPQVSPFSHGATRPGKVAEDFLMELLRDRSGSSSEVYLLPELLDGTDNVYGLLGIETIYSSFEYVIIDNGVGDGQALIEVTLNYETPMHLALALTLEDDLWRISEIIR
jgi:hypothetical protein